MRRINIVGMRTSFTMLMSMVVISIFVGVVAVVSFVIVHDNWLISYSA
jgi:hypothetical protein